MSRCLLLLSVFSVLTALSNIQQVHAESPSGLPPVDVSVSIVMADDMTDLAEAKVLITAKDATEFKTVQAIVGALPQIDESRVFLTVVPKDKPLFAPRTTGDRQIGINLSIDPIEVFVTDGMPYAITSRLSEALSKSLPSKRVVVKSTHDLAKGFQQKQSAKFGAASHKNPFGG